MKAIRFNSTFPRISGSPLVLVCILMNGLFGEGELHTKILNKTQWQRHTCKCYFILNLDHVSVAYAAANMHVVVHATF